MLTEHEHNALAYLERACRGWHAGAAKASDLRLGPLFGPLCVRCRTHLKQVLDGTASAEAVGDGTIVHVPAVPAPPAPKLAVPKLDRPAHIQMASVQGKPFKGF